ncbi:MAG: hypothetical protein QOC71_816, partial [Thermoplasmata archaeon]|nr:hypothetical protein [Thermoplasmata archaeon]
MRGCLAFALALLLAGCAGPGPSAAPSGDHDEAAAAFPALPPLPCEPDRSATGLSPSLGVVAFETFGGDGVFREEIDTAHIGGRTILAISQPG